jgi:hypothetical protein
MHSRFLISAVILSALVACTQSPSPNPGMVGSSDPSSELGLGAHGVAVFALNNRVVTVPVTDWSQDFRTKVEDYYPSACFDRDDNHNGLPSTFEAEGAEDDSDGGTHAEDEADADAGEHSGLRCQRCNRGPGTQGDFRLRLEGQNAELARGRVLSVQADSFTVPSPDGDITVQFDAATQFDDGTPTPGAEIRAEGVVSTGTRTFLATRIKVLCPGPATLPDDVLGGAGSPTPAPTPAEEAGTTEPAPAADAGSIE